MTSKELDFLQLPSVYKSGGNCGIGPGGFEEGNDCAKGGGGGGSSGGGSKGGASTGRSKIGNAKNFRNMSEAIEFQKKNKIDGKVEGHGAGMNVIRMKDGKFFADKPLPSFQAGEDVDYMGGSGKVHSISDDGETITVISGKQQSVHDASYLSKRKKK